MLLVVQFRHPLVARELHLLQVLVQVALVMVDRVLALLVLAAPLVAHVPPVVPVLLVPLALSVLVAAPVVDPVVLVVDPVVPVLAVPVVEVVLVAALDRVVVVVLLAVVAVVAVVERMICSRQ